MNATLIFKVTSYALAILLMVSSFRDALFGVLSEDLKKWVGFVLAVLTIGVIVIFLTYLQRIQVKGDY